MWRVIPGQLLAFREWDGEAVLYNDLSGGTHLLDGMAIDVLRALAAAPRSASALAAELGAGLDAGLNAGLNADSDRDEMTLWVEDLLAELARFDLVEFYPC